MKQGMVWNEVLIEGSEAILCLMCLIKSIEELQNGRIRGILQLVRCVTVFRPKGVSVRSLLIHVSSLFFLRRLHFEGSLLLGMKNWITVTRRLAREWWGELK